MSPQLRQGTDHHHDDDHLAHRRSWRQPVLTIEALSSTALNSSGVFDGSAFS